jgi:hypothetical protein
MYMSHGSQWKRQNMIFLTEIKREELVHVAACPSVMNPFCYMSCDNSVVCIGCCYIVPVSERIGGIYFLETYYA